MEKLQNHQISRFAVPVENTVGQNNLLISALKRWHIIIMVFITVCLIGIPLIWYLVKPYYQATAAVRIVPVLQNILTEGEDGIPMYSSFLNTQAELIASDKILGKVADDLKSSNINLKEQPENKASMENLLKSNKTIDYILQLRDEINAGNLIVEPQENTELIKISMKSSNPQKAEKITNSLVSAYMSSIKSEEEQDDDNKLKILTDENSTLRDKLDKLRNELKEMTKEYGSQSLDPRQNIMLQQVAALQKKLTDIQMDKMSLLIQIQLQDANDGIEMLPENFTKMRYEFVNDDLMIKGLTEKIIQLENDLITAKQHLTPTSSNLADKMALLDSMKKKLDERRSEADKDFNDIIIKEFATSQKEHKKNLYAQLEQLSALESQVKESLAKEDKNAIELGRKQLAMQDLQDQLDLNKQLYQNVQHKINEVELERKRPARISVAYYANTALFKDNHKKYTFACIFAALFLGMAVAAVVDKLDVSIHAPSDLTKTSDVRLLGTTPCIKTIKSKQIPLQIENDYQTICANLGLDNGMKIPHKLVVSSAGPKEGKTTFSINLATSLTRLGKKVLLIEGDFRKPDIARILNIQEQDDWVRKLFYEKDFDKIAYKTHTGLSVLGAGTCCEPYAIYKLVKNKVVQSFLNKISPEYDYIIIDSPPVLAVPDALFWAQISDSVILTGFAGQTEGPHLQEAIQRFKQMKAKILGVVLNNYSNNCRYDKYTRVYLRQKRIRKTVLPESNTTSLITSEDQKI